MRFCAPVAAFASLILALTLGPVRDAAAGGYLWLGSEFQGEGNIYRFNLATGMIDMVQAHAGSDHWNNMAIDDSSLYLGHPSSNTFNRHDPGTGALITPGTYSGTGGGNMEDGAAWDGSLWRINYTGGGALFRMTTAGVIETTFTASNPGFVGLEFIQDTAFATTYNPRTIGTLRRTSPTTLEFDVRSWATGETPTANLGALAYDVDEKRLYMTTAANTLYEVTFVNGEAYTDEVVDLSTVGYPSGGLVDGMGWLREETVDVPAPGQPRSQRLQLSAPWPNPARDAVWFELHLQSPTALHVGVYDVTGRAHRSWNLPGMGAGTSRFMWDFRGTDGQRVPAGQYFVRVSSDEGVVSRAVTRVE